MAKLYTVKNIVERVVNYLRREGFYVNYCEIREHRGKFEILLKLERNIAGLSIIKIVFSKKGEKLFVFTGKTSLDLRLKRFIKRIIEAERSEITLQEEDTGSSATTK
ncbi:MAG: hypothetical protein LM567_02135 [Desulfurococcaceae archaeon]|jgi:ribosome biogenesis protein Nip4|nr:hypothetical protein [Desulfurococcaceae archaeon]